MKWTTEKDAALKRLWPTKSASEIASEIGTTRNAVIGRFHRLQGDYADYISPGRKESRAQTAARHEAQLLKENEAIKKMKERIAAGLRRNDAIKLARKSGARLETIGQVFGVTRQRIGQIESAA
ncbi:MAG TPA: GcrA family cell cycle regulator [Verrucomicrobiae bacterium]|nr:GcrA family cell cycle regulator [Verrucomicrobiae bacterium]